MDLLCALWISRLRTHRKFANFTSTSIDSVRCLSEHRGVSIRRKIAVAAACCAGLLVLALVGLHFYLRWETARYRASLVRNGEKLNVEELLPPRASDENGAPQLRMAASRLPQWGAPNFRVLSESPPIAMRLVSAGHAIVGWQQSDLRGHSTQSQTNTWDELRTELEPLAPLLTDIQSALKSPAFDFQLNYALGSSLPLPHLNSLRTAMQILNSSTLLYLHDENRQAAMECLAAQVALIRVLENEPLPISQSIRARFVQSALGATWEALQAKGWSDAELAHLQVRWEAIRFLGPFAASAALDRATRIHEIHWIQQSRQNYDAFMRAALPGQTLPGAFGPLPDDLFEAMRELPKQSFRSFTVGFDVWCWRYFSSYRDERSSMACTQVAIEALRTALTNRSYMTVRSNLSAGFAKLGYPEPNVDWCGYGLSVHDLFAGATSDSSRLCRRALYAETQRELVVTAIALERYRLRHGHPPIQLNALVPEFFHDIPRDYMDGQPLRYQLNADQMPVLYSIGADGNDDNGDNSPPDRLSGPPAGRWLNSRDWVWPQPATLEEIEHYNARLGEQIRKTSSKQVSGQRRRSASN